MDTILTPDSVPWLLRVLLKHFPTRRISTVRSLLQCDAEEISPISSLQASVTMMKRCCNEFKCKKQPGKKREDIGGRDLKEMWVERWREREVPREIHSGLNKRRKDGVRGIKTGDEIRNIAYESREEPQ